MTKRARSREGLIAVGTSWAILLFLDVAVIVNAVRSDGASTAARVAVPVLALLFSGGLVHRQFVLLEGRDQRTQSRWLLVGVGVLILPFPEGRAMIGVLLAVVMLLSSTRRQAAIIGAAIGAVAVMATVVNSEGISVLLSTPVVSVLTAATLYVLTRMAVVLEELRRTRERLARMRVDEDRHRISRELHDVIGRVLAAASLRAQHAARRLPADADESRTELDHVVKVLGDGQRELRTLVLRDVGAHFAQELDSVVELLDRLHIAAIIDVDRMTDGPSSTLCAAVLREAGTNMLKHSWPRQVAISVKHDHGMLRLVVCNDGAEEHVSHGGCTGLANLSRRVDEAGGTMAAGPLVGGRFEVRAELPVFVAAAGV